MLCRGECPLLGRGLARAGRMSRTACLDRAHFKRSRWGFDEQAWLGVMNLETRITMAVQLVNCGIEGRQELRVGIEPLLHWLARMSVLGCPPVSSGAGRSCCNDGDNPARRFSLSL